ncbi:DUF4177 domain-containing protein [Roseicyclus sp.]|uniref:DUF4177 domain-containing protein n=1 Tax=Roseicyclus sp. TaxID=1914329 RepID=UPI003F6ABE50
MQRYEYKLVPAPQRATKHKGLKGADLFAATLQEILNALGQEGWEYQRAETLPEEVRTGLTARTTTYRQLLVFRRALPDTTSQQPAPAQITARPEGQPSLANLFLDREDGSDPRN